MSGQSLVVVEICAGLFAVPFAALFMVLVRWRQRHAQPMRPPRQGDLVALGASEQVAGHLAAGNKIAAIKAYREETGTGLYDAKTAIDGFVRRVQMRALLAVGASERVAGLLANGDTIGAIKAYREQTGAGLREAKDYIDGLRRRQ